MPRSSALVALLALIVAGCARPPQPVYVNLGGVNLDKWSQPSAVASSSAPAFGAPTGRLQALPAARLFLGENEQRVRRAQETMKETREAARKEVSRQLAAAASLEVDRKLREELRKLEPRQKEILDAAYEAVRPIFDQHVEASWPLRLELIKLVGFPDPDPKSLRRPDPRNERAVSDLARAKELRSQIATMDAAYKSRVDAVLASALDKIAEEKAALTASMAELAASLQRSAEVRVNQLVGEQWQALEGRSALAGDTLLRAQPAVTVQPMRMPVAPPAPQPPPSPGSALARQQLLAEAKVWAATNGYRLVDRPGLRAPDKTLEFIRWRRQMLPSR